MRDIKFRAWMESCGVMTYEGFHVSAPGSVWMWTDHKYNNSVEINNPVMQFTGLKDKNGKEIWEGDIMKVPQRTVGKGKLTKRKDFFIPVQFYNGGFDLPFINYGEYRFRDGGMESYEVIGNIYEHPNLMTQ